MTRAPWALAISPVRSEELLSQTMISYSQPTWKNAAAALRMLCNERSMSFSSLKAGTMIEIFTGLLLETRPRSQLTARRVPVGILGRRHPCRLGHRRVDGGSGVCGV